MTKIPDDLWEQTKNQRFSCVKFACILQSNLSLEIRTEGFYDSGTEGFYDSLFRPLHSYMSMTYTLVADLG